MTVRTREDAARILADTSEDKRFFCHDGCVSSNLFQLAECLDHMKEDSYRHHVTSLKNDFSNWVRDVLGDDKLANDLGPCTDNAEAARAVRNRIAWLKKKLK